MESTGVSSLYSETQRLLDRLQQQLQEHQLWQAQPPRAEAFESTVPFCYDTMHFEQWLQFVFIPKMQALLDAQLPLPSVISLAPMAEQMWQGRAVSSIVACLANLDALLTSQRQSAGGE